MVMNNNTVPINLGRGVICLLQAKIKVWFNALAPCITMAWLIWSNGSLHVFPLKLCGWSWDGWMLYHLVHVQPHTVVPYHNSSKYFLVCEIIMVEYCRWEIILTTWSFIGKLHHIHDISSFNICKIRHCASPFKKNV